jgi:hypothetical protein
MFFFKITWWSSSNATRFPVFLDVTCLAFMPSYWQAAGALVFPGTEATAAPCNAIKPVFVTAPASILPQDFESVPIVTDVSASTFPCISENVPIVAELPTCHQTLEALAPPISTIWLPGAPGAPAAVVRAEGA